MKKNRRSAKWTPRNALGTTIWYQRYFYSLKCTGGGDYFISKVLLFIKGGLLYDINFIHDQWPYSTPISMKASFIYEPFVNNWKNAEKSEEQGNRMSGRPWSRVAAGLAFVWNVHEISVTNISRTFVSNISYLWIFVKNITCGNR